MSIIRAARKETYTNIDNKLINDPALDWKDLGLLVYLLSKPDHWAVNAEHLAKQRNLGIKGIYTGLKAICTAGYASKKPNPKGGWDWMISDEKSHIVPASPINMPNSDNRNADNRNAENVRLVTTDSQVNTEKSSNVVVVTREESFIDVGNHSQERARDLTGKEMTLTTEQGECKNWASTQNYWATCTASNEEFLKVWCKPNQTLRKQFDAHKKALQDGLGQTGHSYTSSKTNRTGGNYAPSTSKSNKHNDFTKAGYYENGGFNADGSF